MAPPQHRCFLDLRHDDAVPLTILTRGRPLLVMSCLYPSLLTCTASSRRAVEAAPRRLILDDCGACETHGVRHDRGSTFLAHVLRGACAILLCRVHAALSHGFVCASGCRVFGYAVYLRMCSFKPITHSVMISNRPKPILPSARSYTPRTLGAVLAQSIDERAYGRADFIGEAVAAQLRAAATTAAAAG